MFFAVEDDLVTYGDRRFLGRAREPHGREVELWSFMEFRQITVEPPLVFPINQHGRPVDVSFGVFGEVVVHQRVIDALGPGRLGGVQVIPARVEGSREPYAAINVLDCYACFDFARSDFEGLYTEENERSELLGQPKFVFDLKIHPERVGSANFFRVKEHFVTIVCDAEVRDVLLSIAATGVRFTEVG